MKKYIIRKFLLNFRKKIFLHYSVSIASFVTIINLFHKIKLFYKLVLYLHFY